MKVTPQQILDFWFNPQKTTAENVKFWFAGTQKIDDEIKKNFESTVLAASEGQLTDWEKDPLSCLALTIVLDQFPLNIYRDQAKSFHLNDMALPIAQRALQQGFDQKVKPLQRVFFYLPFEHSEDLNIQKKSVQLFEKLNQQASPEDKKFMEMFLDYAIKHLVVVERFGRFPDRNPILGRKHTPPEAEYMAQGGPPF
jgi:uncharacterized protein (DUF924 family)